MTLNDSLILCSIYTRHSDDDSIIQNGINILHSFKYARPSTAGIVLYAIMMMMMMMSSEALRAENAATVEKQKKKSVANCTIQHSKVLEVSCSDEKRRIISKILNLNAKLSEIIHANSSNYVCSVQRLSHSILDSGTFSCVHSLRYDCIVQA